MIKSIIRIDLIPIVVGGFTGLFFSELGMKVLTMTTSMVIGTTVSFYWKRYLARRDKGDKNKSQQ